MAGVNGKVPRRVVLGGAAGVVGVVGLSGVAGAGTTAAKHGDAIRPVGLTTEHVVDPLGVESDEPRFGWRLRAPGRDRAQTAYRILVASTRDRLLRGRPDVWDSGRVESAEQTAVRYGGPAPRSRTRYHWAVRVWDEAGRPGPLSESAWFETGLLSDEEWSADWIGSGLELPKPTRTLGPTQTEGVPLTADGTLGQSFVSAAPITAVVVLLTVPEGESAGCVMTLRRNGPDGAVLGRQRVTDLVGDKYREASARLDLSDPAPPGDYHLELAAPEGEVGWEGVTYSSAEEDNYPDGTAFVDGERKPLADRWLYALAPDPPADPLLRREFELDEAVVSARLYIAGLGHAVAWVNGRRVDDIELSPFCTDYDVRAFYTTHDVTGSLREGRNALGVALGRGFFGTRAPHTDGSHLAPWLAEPQLKAQLEVVLASGRRVTIGTGSDWSLTEGPTTHDGLYAGESYDARRAAELSGWTDPGFPSAGWEPASVVPGPGGRLEAYVGTPIRAGEPVEPVAVSEPAEGVRLYDFGTVMSGWVRLRGRLPDGSQVRLQYGEKLGPDGRVYTGIAGGNDNSTIDGRFQVDEYTAAGRGMESWQPSFTYKGFRYVEVSGTTRSLDVAAIPVQSDVTSTMRLELDDPMLQWIADTIRQTNLNGIHGHPDISPLAKLGWLSAAERASQPLLYMFDMTSPFDKWLEDIRLIQRPSGELPMIAPVGGFFAGVPISPTTTASYPTLVRRYWRMYGDPTVPARHFEAVRKYVDWVVEQTSDQLPQDIFGDWYPPRTADEPSDPSAPEGGTLVALAYIIRNLRDATVLADLLGRTQQAEAWRAETDRQIRRFNAAFLDIEASVYRTEQDVGYRQTNNAIPLAFDLVPDAHVDAVAANLAADVEARDRHLNTGALGTGALPFALSDNGRADLAHAVLRKRDYPSYGYLRELGATALWESWEAESRAHNDPTLSEPARWFVERVLGVELVEPGWARFRVAPAAFGPLRRAALTLDTVRGRIAVAWRRDGRDGRELTLVVRVPVNAVAEVTLPDGERRELGSGTYQFAAEVDGRS